ncbi:hypothetical protein PC111_g7218 [Phytophthora cactorum]|nr:hypothetical protein PC111_g7218 [Phytophthora cactorum]
MCWSRKTAETQACCSALFPSFEALLTHVRDFGYAIVIQKSSVPRGQLGLRCDLGGGRRRTLRNQHSDCPFHLYARRLRSGKWEINVQNATHSHEAAPLALHPVACRLSSGQRLAEIGEEQEALKAEMQYNDIGASCGFPWRVVAIRKRDKSGNGDAQEDTRDQLNNLQGNKQLQTHSFAAT